MKKSEKVDQLYTYIYITTLSIIDTRPMRKKKKRRESNEEKRIRNSTVNVEGTVAHTYYTYLRMHHQRFSLHYSIERRTNCHHLNSYQALYKTLKVSVFFSPLLIRRYLILILIIQILSFICIL